MKSTPLTKEEEKSTDPQTDIQKEAKDFVLKELETSGVISQLKAKIKSSVLTIIQNQKESFQQKLDFDYMTPLHRQAKSKDVLLICHLIKEFLKFYEMDYTAPIFENESNIKERIKRESLIKELGLPEQKKEEQKPLLLQLLIEYQNKKKLLETMNKDFGAKTYSSGFSGFQSKNEDNMAMKRYDDDTGSRTIPGRIQLNPINIQNKSVELKDKEDDGDENKFNSINISDVYKRPKVETKTETKIEINNATTTTTTTMKTGDVVIEKKDEEYNIEDITENIPEEIVTDKKKDNDNDEGMSMSQSETFGYDSSVKQQDMKNFDYAEDVENPK